MKINTILDIVLLSILLMFIAKTKVCFNPFSISFGAPYLALACIFLGLSIGLFSTHYEEVGYQKGITKSVKEEIKEILLKDE